MVRTIQRLSTEKLNEITKLLNRIKQPLKSKEKTLQLAGTWKELNDELFSDLTEKLHNNRANDRQLN